MTTSPSATLSVHLTPEDLAATMRADVRAGLTGTPKTLPPKYFYDARGSELFEEITRLPEYYPTRTERGLLTEHAGIIARLAAADTLVELGSGSSEKTRLLLDALTAAGTLRQYVPLDVSPSAIEGALADLAPDYPGVALHGVVADFADPLAHVPTGGRRLVAFLGSTIGNLTPPERADFLSAVRAGLGPDDTFLLGTDLVKSPEVLVPAYDDAAGVTAEFNRNVLHVLNRTLGATFDVEGFEHVAVWDAEHEWIEMRLRARRPMRVVVADLDLVVTFGAGEELRTEISAKFRRGGVVAELAAADLELAGWWTDPAGAFALSLSRPLP